MNGKAGRSSGLTEMQRKFVEKYIELGNKTEAYVQAGYSSKSKRIHQCRAADRLLKIPHVAAYYQELIRAKRNSNIATVDEVLEFYTGVMRGEIKDAFGLDPTLSDRLKAADALAKRYQIFTQKLEVETTQAIQIIEDLEE